MRNEFSVEVRNKETGSFISQIDVVETIEEAEQLMNEENKNLNCDEEIDIYCIERDDQDIERAYYFVE